jgi:hypothetical protein
MAIHAVFYSSAICSSPGVTPFVVLLTVICYKTVYITDFLQPPGPLGLFALTSTDKTLSLSPPTAQAGAPPKHAAGSIAA